MFQEKNATQLPGPSKFVVTQWISGITQCFSSDKSFPVPLAVWDTWQDSSDAGNRWTRQILITSGSTGPTTLERGGVRGELRVGCSCLNIVILLLHGPPTAKKAPLSSKVHDLCGSLIGSQLSDQTTIPKKTWRGLRGPRFKASSSQSLTLKWSDLLGDNFAISRDNGGAGYIAFMAMRLCFKKTCVVFSGALQCS